MLSHPLLLALTGVLPLSFLLRDGGPLLRQGNVFLRDYGQPPYSRRLIFRLMALVWLVGGGVALLTGPMSTLSTVHGLQTWGLMLFSLNLMALDAQERWLPLCFTHSFWGAGVLLTLLPGALLTFDAAVVNSLLVFVLLRLVYRVLAQKRPDALGLGDVHLLAGLCAWLPLAGLTCALTLYMVLTFCLVGRSTPHPLAPWLLPVVLLVHFLYPVLLTEGSLYGA